MKNGHFGTTTKPEKCNFGKGLQKKAYICTEKSEMLFSPKTWTIPKLELNQTQKWDY